MLTSQWLILQKIDWAIFQWKRKNEKQEQIYIYIQLGFKNL